MKKTSSSRKRLRAVLTLHDVQELENNISTDIEDSSLTRDAFRARFTGKNGVLTKLFAQISTVEEKDRAVVGALLNELKRRCDNHEKELAQRSSRQVMGEALLDKHFDVTAPFAPNTPIDKRPGLNTSRGTLHPISSVGESAVRIFESMGFHVVESRRLEDDYNGFEALNIPKGHPARDLWDTFWTEDGLIPTTQTSAMQNRIYRTVKPPIREIIIGKCFRNEATDASHEHTFYQLEGVYVDRGITLSDLIGTLSSFMNAFYGKDIKYKIQPSYFPFVEPGLEFLIECLVCGQVGCPFCKYTGWIELVPCGPIHPHVLREGGLNPDEFSGFAWGLGYDRLVMLRNHISDIRYLHSGDLKFLEQFI